MPGISNMAKKIFVSKARIVKGDRWVIDYTRMDPETGKETRHRQDFDLNDIPDLRIREEVANRLVKQLHIFIRYDSRPAPAPGEDEPAMNVSDAVKYALKVKTAAPRPNTHKNYVTIANQLLKWLESRSYANLPAGEFSKRHARAFFDWYLFGRDYRGVTINNRIVHLRSMWSELLDREIVAENVWKAIKPVQEEEKLRRIFEPDERRIIAQEAQSTDYWLFRGILLQFFCYIRPVEIHRLRFKDFDFVTGTIKVEVWKGKSPRMRWATIPKSIMHYFLDGRFENQPANYFVFGLVGDDGAQGVGPSIHATHPNRMYKRHRKMLERLKADGRLKHIEHLTWYGWKDTGISLHAHRTTPLATKDQAGHTDFDVTLIYYHAQQVNQEYAQLANDLFT